MAGQTRNGASEFAVLVPILLQEGEECVLLTKRPDTLPQYPGQIAFPGGARDPEDRDLFATAVREAREEVGIGAERITLVRELGWHSTLIGHRVKPFVARVAPGPIVPSPQEVERVLYLPTAVIRGDPFRSRGVWRDAEGRERITWTFPWEGCEVWGLTARILREYFVEEEQRERGT